MNDVFHQGAGIGLISIGSMISDCIVFYLSKKRFFYQKYIIFDIAKFKTTQV